MDGVLDNLENALRTWADKLAEIWNLLTQDPETFRGGTIWNIIRSIHGSLQAIGLALLVLFFLYGVIKQTTNLREVKRPENKEKFSVPRTVQQTIPVDTIYI